MTWWESDPTDDPLEAALVAEGVTGARADIARSIYQQESGSGRNTTTSWANARGGMQVIPATFQRMADQGWDIDDPVHNARAGVRYINSLYERAGGDPRLTAIGYYGGEGAQDKARQGVAVRPSDPRGAKDPDTFAYADKVVSRLKPGDDWWSSDPKADDQWWASDPKMDDSSGAGRGSADDPRRLDRQVVEPEPGWWDRVKKEGAQLRDELFLGATNVVAGGSTLTAVAANKQLQDRRDALTRLEAAGQGDSDEAQTARKWIAAYEKRNAGINQNAADDLRLAQAAGAMTTRPEVRKLVEAKTFGEAWEAFKEAPYQTIAGLTAQSLPAMLPGLLAAAATANPAAAVAAMGANSAIQELGSSVADWARDNKIDPSDTKALADLLADPGKLREALGYAGKRAGIIGLADGASAGLASKTMAPKIVTGAVARQAINMPAQMAAQMASGAGGEAAAQIATKGRIDQPGQVVAEAVGELGGAPVEVAALSRELRPIQTKDMPTTILQPEQAAAMVPLKPIEPAQIEREKVAPVESDSTAGQPDSPENIGVGGAAQGVLSDRAQKLIQRAEEDMAQQEGEPAPRITPGLYANPEAAMSAAAAEQIDAEPIQIEGGWGLLPKAQPQTIGQLREDARAVERLEGAINRHNMGREGPVQLELVHESDNAAASGPKGGSRQVIAGLRAATGLRITVVRGLGDNGVAIGSRAFIDESALSSPEAVSRVAIGTAGHEAAHALEKANPDAYAVLVRAVREFGRQGVVAQRLALENEHRGVGQEEVTPRYAANEVIADINGGMWLDHKFWSRLYELDQGSTFRKVFYQFMRVATRLMKVAGTTFDANRYVTNVDAVREAAAQAWAMNNRKPVDVTAHDVQLEFRLEGGGTGLMKINAGRALQQIDDREQALAQLLRCLS